MASNKETPNINPYEDLQTRLQRKIKECYKALKQRGELCNKLIKIKEVDEEELNTLKNNNLHPDDPKYQQIEKDKYDLEESCKNAKKAIKQIFDESTEISKQCKEYESELSRIIKI